MVVEPPAGLGASLSSLRPKDKEPRTASVLNGWVNQAESSWAWIPQVAVLAG